jgi:hypothetical protein
LIGGAPRAAIAQTTQPTKPTQSAQPEPSAQQPSPPPVSSFSTSVDVVGVTPVTGAGVLRDKIPSNVQSLDIATNPRVGVSAADWLMTLASIQINEAQSNPFQPDLQFRGKGWSRIRMACATTSRSATPSTGT